MDPIFFIFFFAIQIFNKVIWTCWAFIFFVHLIFRKTFRCSQMNFVIFFSLLLLLSFLLMLFLFKTVEWFHSAVRFSAWFDFNIIWRIQNDNGINESAWFPVVYSKFYTLQISCRINESNKRHLLPPKPSSYM